MATEVGVPSSEFHPLPFCTFRTSYLLTPFHSMQHGDPLRVSDCGLHGTRPTRLAGSRGRTKPTDHITPWPQTRLPVAPPVTQAAASRSGLRLWTAVLNIDHMNLMTQYGGPDLMAPGKNGFVVRRAGRRYVTNAVPVLYVLAHRTEVSASRSVLPPERPGEYIYIYRHGKPRHSHTCRTPWTRLPPLLRFMLARSSPTRQCCRHVCTRDSSCRPYSRRRGRASSLGGTSRVGRHGWGRVGAGWAGMVGAGLEPGRQGWGWVGAG